MDCEQGLCFLDPLLDWLEPEKWHKLLSLFFIVDALLLLKLHLAPADVHQGVVCKALTLIEVSMAAAPRRLEVFLDTRLRTTGEPT